MSVKAMTWAWSQAVGHNGDKLLLLALADHANDDGECWPGQRRLAEKCECTARTISSALKRLEAKGLLGREPRYREGHRTTDMVVLALAAPLFIPEDPSGEDLSGSRSIPETGDSSYRKVATVHTGSLFPGGTVIEPPREPSGAVRGRAGGDHLSLVERKPPRRPEKVNGKTVSEDEHDAVDEILEAFAREAGTRYTAEGFRRAIVMRLREHPEMTIDVHREILKRNFETPWWKGSGGPNVIYGSAEQFERSMACRGRVEDPAVARMRAVREAMEGQ